LALSGSDDTTVRVWSTSTLRELHEVCASLDRDGQCLQGAIPTSWLNAKQHSLHTHDCPQIDTGHTRNIFCCKFVPRDGDARVVSCGADGMVCAPRLPRSVLRGPLQNVCA
jgi:WD40 repeat protein